VYEPGAASIAAPDPEERLRRMLEAGVPRETAEKVIELTAEVQKLQATPEPGAYRPEDLSPESRQQLQPLLDRGVPMERAVQMLLLQEKYRRTLEELSTLQGRTPSTSSGEQERN
jgi:type II secretory pathway component PulF